MRVPLASFAANSELSGTCVIYVEYLDSRESNGQKIVFGSLFFQSIYA